MISHCIPQFYVQNTNAGHQELSRENKYHFLFQSSLSQSSSSLHSTISNIKKNIYILQIII